MRQFISGHVANSMAAEVIELLHSLMNAPVSNTARSWAEAVQRVRDTFLLLLILSEVLSRGVEILCLTCPTWSHFIQDKLEISI